MPFRGRPRPHRGGGVLVCVMVSVAVLLLGLLTACSSSSGSPAAPTTAQIGALLTRQSAAVRDGSKDDYTAGLSDAAASSAFVATQGAVFDNLTRLTFSTWTYSVGIRTDDPAAEKAATTKYGAPAVIRKVTLRYALRGYDPRPTSHDLYWTFIQQHGKAVVAADDGLANAGGDSWKGPWDFGPLVVGQGTSALVLAHASAGNLTTIVKTADAAVPAVTAVWGSDWARKVVVVIPSTDAELRADAGLSSELTRNIPAETVSDTVDPATRTALGLRLVVNPTPLGLLSAAGRAILFRHEITHIAAGAVTSETTPRWLVEGMADYVGLLTSGQSVTTAAAELTVAVRAGKVPTALPVDTAFDTDATAASAYEQGWLACRLIARDIGQAGLVRFYRAVSASYDPGTALTNALSAQLHTTVAAFTASWRAYLRSELG